MKCTGCGGEGKVELFTSSHACEACGGTGRILDVRKGVYSSNRGAYTACVIKADIGSAFAHCGFDKIFLIDAMTE